MNIKKVKISENVEAYKRAEQDYKTSLNTIARIQAISKGLGVDLKDSDIKDSKDVYTMVVDALYVVKTKGFKMPKMDSEGFLKLQGLDLSELKNACDVLVVMPKPKKADFVRYAKSKEEADRVELLKKYADIMNQMVKDGIILRPETIRTITNHRLVLGKDGIEFNPHTL